MFLGVNLGMGSCQQNFVQNSFTGAQNFWILKDNITVNKPVISYNLQYIVTQMWPLCSVQILVGALSKIFNMFCFVLIPTFLRMIIALELDLSKNFASLALASLQHESLEGKLNLDCSMLENA